jgi:hypothetical protein
MAADPLTQNWAVGMSKDTDADIDRQINQMLLAVNAQMGTIRSTISQIAEMVRKRVGETGPVGPQGDAGPEGPQGPQGPKGEKGDRGRDYA